jgi:hypothetical protein
MQVIFSQSVSTDCPPIELSSHNAFLLVVPSIPFTCEHPQLLFSTSSPVQPYITPLNTVSIQPHHSASYRQTSSILIIRTSPPGALAAKGKNERRTRESSTSYPHQNVSSPTTTATIDISSNTKTQTLNVENTINIEAFHVEINNTKSSSPAPLPRNTPRLQHPQQRRRNPAIIRTIGLVRSGEKRGK